MELDKFARQLRLMELLTHNYQYSIEEVSEKLKMSKRSIYRYIDAFKSMGFVVRKAGSKYRLDHSSPFFQNITKDITFTEDEGLTLCEVLNSVYNNSVQIRYLREKLGRLYSTDVLAKHGVDNQVAQNISTIYQCIREERVALLKNYDSPSSGKVSDRVVEPYMFLNENAEVRCFELSSGMNKTFKLSRAEKVEKSICYGRIKRSTNLSMPTCSTFQAKSANLFHCFWGHFRPTCCSKNFPIHNVSCISCPTAAIASTPKCAATKA